MQTITEIALQHAVRGVFTRGEAALWVASDGARLDALLKRAVAADEVWRIVRGLYCLSTRFLKGSRIDPLALAQRVHGPSYVSLETALSYHGWIPEGVQTLTSAALARSREFRTPLGVFSFTRVPQVRFMAGVRRISPPAGGSFYLATPLKALADTVYVQRHDWISAAPVVQSLRVGEESLAELSGELFDEVLSAYPCGRVRRFLDGLRRNLKV